MSSCVILTIGLCYGGNNKLNGTINDSLLIEKMFSGPNFVMKLRSGKKPVTKANIIEAVKAWLAYDPQKPHIFHFAGHGGQSHIQKKRELLLYENVETENDNKDEVLYDEHFDVLVDNDFASLFKEFKSPLVFIMDNCHSDRFVEVCPQNKVISIAACKESDTAPEIYVTNLFGQDQVHGVLTDTLTKVMANHAKDGKVDLVEVLKKEHAMCHARISPSTDEFIINITTKSGGRSPDDLYVHNTVTFDSNDSLPIIETLGYEKKLRTGCFC